MITQTTILQQSDTEDASDWIHLEAGDAHTLFLRGEAGASVEVQAKVGDFPEKFTAIGRSSPMRRLQGPLVYRVQRRPGYGLSVTVYSDGALEFDQP